MEQLLQDIRYGVRMLVKTPALTAIALFTLALGIGANTAIFSVVDAVLLRPFPYADSERLLVVSLESKQQGPGGGPLSVADFLDWQAQNRNFEIAAYGTDLMNFVGDGNQPEQVRGAGVTAGFFSTLGVRPALGRTFVAGEDKPGQPPVVVISDNFWRTRFNADPQVIDRSVILSDRPYTVVGVMPPVFNFPQTGSQVWVCEQLNPPTRRGPYFFFGIARFPAATSLAGARGELAETAQRIRQSHPELSPDYGFVSVPLRETVVGKVRPALIVLLGAVALVLLIAALNVANLLLARAVAREREISIRSALGASPGRIARQLLTESLLLALVGGIVGLLVAQWSLDVLFALSPANIPRLHEVKFDGRVLSWTILVSLGTGVLSGLAPAIQTSRAGLSNSLKDAGRGSTEGVGRRRLRSGLVVSEIALALTLLVASGLLIKSFVLLQQVDAGFHATHALTMQVPLSRAKYPERPQVFGFYDRLLERIRALPGVKTAAIASSLPPNQLEWSDNYLTEGQQPQDDAHLPIGSMLFVSPDYFRTLGIPLRRGRDFNSGDKVGAPAVVIVSETLARRAFGTDDVIGKRLKVGGTDRPDNPWCEIIGVVADVKYEGLDAPPAPAFYESALQYSYRGMYVVIDSSIDIATLTPQLRNAVHALDPEIPVANIQTIEQLVHESVAQPRFRTVLIGSFSGLALLLAALGIYGVMAYTVTERTHEIGVRMALGAQTGDVLKLVLGEGLTLALIGVVLGLGGAFCATRLIASLLFGVGATDPLVYGGLALLLIGVAVVACLAPAVRAARVNPVVALNRN